MFARKIQEALDSDLYVPLISRPEQYLWQRENLPARNANLPSKHLLVSALMDKVSTVSMFISIWLNLMRSREEGTDSSISQFSLCHILEVD